MPKLIDTKPFKAALRCAKAHVVHDGRDELTIQDFLIGCVLACRLNKLSDSEQSSVAKIKTIDKRYFNAPASSASLGLSEKDSSLNVHVSLRKLLGKKSDTQSFAEFVTKCIEAHEEQVRLDEGLVCFGVDGHSELKSLWAICCAILEQTGHPTLDAAVVAASLKIAADHDILDGSPTAKELVGSHSSVVECLMKERGWENLSSHPSMTIAAPQMAALGHDLRDALADIKSSPDPLLHVIKIAMARAVRAATLERIAYHEAGHALASLLLRPKVKITEVSIMPKSDSGGRVSFEDIGLIRQRAASREDVHEDLLVLLAGRVAELKKFGFDAADSGASDDLKRATSILWTAITEHGLDPEFGPINLSAVSEVTSRQSGWLYDEAQKRLQALMKKAQDECSQLIDAQWSLVEMLAVELLKRKEMSEGTVREVCSPSGDLSVMRWLAPKTTIFADGVAA